MDPLPFPDRPALRAWLDANAASAPELLVLLRKAGTGVPSVTWEDCVVEALRVGWIDAAKAKGGEGAWVQRLCPRRPRSLWSRRNREHVERLVEAGEMTPAGMAEVERARADGRWDAAYAGSAGMAIPADFLAALEGRPVAKATYAGLNRANLYAIYHRLHTARKADTRARRMAAILDLLDQGRAIH